jgi:hypothetical protein
MIDYFKSKFWNDIETIDTYRPNEVILNEPDNFFVHKEIKFYGGEDWESYSNDISEVPPASRIEFLLCLLTISTFDYYIKNNLQLYTTVRQVYDPPKLGWCGFGPHFEHPYKILKKVLESELSKEELIEKKGSINEVLNFIIEQHSSIDSSDFKSIITNNQKNFSSAPHENWTDDWNVKIEENDIKNWKRIIGKLINN